MSLSTFVSALQLASLVVPVLGHHTNGAFMSRAELSRRQLEANERHVQARACSSQLANYHSKRSIARKRRELQARQATSSGSIISSATSTAATPHFTEIQNFTCITAPEVTEGPYYVNNEYMRTNLTENELGVPLILDIGILDVTNCQPLSNAFVELWNANATGYYAAFEAQSAQSVSGSGGGGGSVSGAPTMSGSAAGGPPSGSPGGGSGGGTGSSTSTSSNNTALRGGYPTNENGIVEMATIYPGFYSGRTPHIHVMVHTNWSASTNGTLLSHDGGIAHIGQFFFNETMNDAVFATKYYLLNTNTRTTNDEDSILDEENADGYNAFVDVTMISNDINDGLYGYITVGVNSSAKHSITSTNYLGGSSLTAGSSGTTGGTSTGGAAAATSFSGVGLVSALMMAVSGLVYIM